MITNSGKGYIKSYLAGNTGAIARSIAFGVDSSSATVNDVSLGFEVQRAEIDLTAYDMVANQVVFRAQIPTELQGYINEVALYSSELSLSEMSSLLTGFDSATESWISGTGPATFVTTNTRIGEDSLSLTPAASATLTAYLADINLDLSGYAGSDIIKMAYYVSDSNTNGITVKFMTDAGNYYKYVLGAQTIGYKIASFTFGGATIVGAPSWENIIQIQLEVTAKSSGTASVNFDGIRVDANSIVDPNDVLVAREVLATPFLRDTESEQQIQVRIGVTV